MSDRADRAEQDLLCPSSQHDVDGALVLGLIEREDDVPRVTYVSGRQPATAELLELTKPLAPTDVFRFAATCKTAACMHFEDGDCRLAKRILAGLAAVSDGLPACAIRKDCRWYAQEGQGMCFRCPQIMTNFDKSDRESCKIAGIEPDESGANGQMKAK